MSNLLASLRTSSSALDALQESVAVAQNNVTNAATPGYVRQRLQMAALAFAPQEGLLGGVTAGGLQSARNDFAEQAVRKQNSLLGQARQSTASLTRMESAFALNDASGIPSALDRLFTSFSAWSVAPNSAAARENVISAAQNVSSSFERTAVSLESSTTEAEAELGSAIGEINHLAGIVQRYNLDRRTGVANDAAAEAQLYETLEKLSGLAEVQAMKQSDGTVTLLLGGQVALVVGDSQYDISLELGYRSAVPPVYSGASPTAYVLNHLGEDVTSHVHSGKVGGLLEFKNQTLPNLLGNAESEGQINRLAKNIADRVNAILAAGYPPPAQPLFVYGSNPVSIAHTLSVSSTITPALLQAVDPGPPAIGNGKPLALSALANPVDAADRLDGVSFVAFYAKAGAAVGRQLSDARTERDSRAQMVAQARSLRSEESGVSLDEEAVRLVEFQRAYQASARMVSILDELTEIAVNIGR